jgi:death-on-curing protein
VRYLTLHEAFIIGEAVTGVDAKTLTSISRIELLDSALHAPQAGFADQEFFSDFFMKASILCSRIARNHALPDGNKRLAWACLVLFCDLNGYTLNPTSKDVVATIRSVALRETTDEDFAEWIKFHAKQK